MEKENLDQFLENRQNYMMDNNTMQQINVAGAGNEIVGVLQEEVVSGVAGEILGGKYDEHHEEHDDGDDDELKYVEEVQQSEKQQQQQLQTLKSFGLDDDGTCKSNELAEKETGYKAASEYGNGNGGFVFGGNHQNLKQQEHHDLFNLGNGHDTNGHDIANTNEVFDKVICTGFEENQNMMERELDGFKNEGDFSSTSNVTESAEGFVPQIDVEIDTKVEHQEIVDEEEPSSLATNTTNGTSSLSENVPAQAVVVAQTNASDNLSEIENSNPLKPLRPIELDLDQAHSQLNPDAKEFVPSFGSNPASPTSPFAAGMTQNEPVLSEIMETQMYFGQAPAIVPRHLMGDDDLVAHSPRKGKGDNNMDAVSLPRELSEFEQEADKRPHDLEPEVIESFNQMDAVMTPDQAIQQLPLDDIVAQDKENHPPADATDFEPSNYMDHGPETCVDLETDMDLQSSGVLSIAQDKDDVMKRSMYVASEDPIEDVLNSVQPIPTEIDSVNNSFIEESATESAVNQLAGDKELLQIEEKEHISHSPSTEEIQMNFQNTLNSSNKDIPQLPNDMDNASHMQESMYVEQEHQLESLTYQQQLKPEEQQEFEEKHQQNDQSDIQPQVFHELKEGQEDFNFVKQAEAEQFNAEGESHDDHLEQPYDEQELIEEPRLGSNELLHDQNLNQDSMAGTLTTALTNESLLGDTTTPLIAEDSFLDNDFSTQHQQQEFNESFSPFKINEEVSNTLLLESLNNDTPANEQEHNIADGNMRQSYTADEKHLLEETKEEQLFSVSGLEQQMSEMMLNNTDDSISQKNEVAPIIATATEISENFTSSIVPEKESKKEMLAQMLVDDSFNRHEEECLRLYQQEHQTKQQYQPDMDIEIENKSDFVNESIESSIGQHHQEQLQSEMAAVEEPVIEARKTAPLFTNEKTEYGNELKIEKERQELPPCMVPETAPAEILEPPMIAGNETANNKIQKDPAQPTTEEVKIDDFKVAATAAAVAATAAVATKIASSEPKSKSDMAKKPLPKTATTALKPKVASTTAAKKTAEVAKKPISLAAKPRPAPARPAGSATDKKPIDKTTTTAAARKPLSTTTATASKLVAKTSTATSTTRTETAASKPRTTSRPATAPRTVPSCTTAARKPTTTNGQLEKPRPTTAPAKSTIAPTKPTTLGLPATNGAPKTKPLSPRSTLTTQVRKTTLATTGTKCPAKPAATNGVTKTAASTLASRTKTTTTTVSSTSGTANKIFTARPAPKFTSSSSTSTTNTNTTTRRSTAGVANASLTATTTTKASSTLLRKSTPTKPATSRTPTKASTTPGGLKSKTPIAKADSPAPKPAPIRKPVDKSAVAAAAVTNGQVDANKVLNGIAEEQCQQETSTQNGDILAVKLEQPQNGDTSIPMQTEKQEQSFLKSRDEQIPMDLINA